MNIGTDITKRYAGIVNENPILTREEEVKLFKILEKIKTTGQDQCVRNKIFNSNVMLVMKYAFKYSHISSIPVEDLIGAGNEGLGMAINKFDYKKGNKFSTYATNWIRLYIYKTLTMMGKIVNIPPHIVDKSRKFREIDCNPEAKMSDKEIKDHLNISEKVLGNIKAAQIKAVYLDRSLCSDDNDQDTLAQVIPDPNCKTASQILMGREKYNYLYEVLTELSPLEKEIITERYLNKEKVNLKDLGKKYKMSGERVRQIGVKALKKLKFRIRKKGILQHDLV